MSMQQKDIYFEIVFEYFLHESVTFCTSVIVMCHSHLIWIDRMGPAWLGSLWQRESWHTWKSKALISSKGLCQYYDILTSYSYFQPYQKTSKTLTKNEINMLSLETDVQISSTLTHHHKCDQLFWIMAMGPAGKLLIIAVIFTTSIIIGIILICFNTSWWAPRQT